MITLPDKKEPAKVTDARFLVIYGKQKTGKSTVCSKLDGALLIDLKDEFDFLEGMKVSAKNLTELGEIITALNERKNAYKYIVLDNSSWLLEMVGPLASKLYRATPLGQNWKGDDVMMLPRGAGYLYQKQAFMQIVDCFRKVTQRFILIGHLKEQNQIGPNGEEQLEYNLDLPQGLRDLVLRNADAIGRFYREENKCVIDFDGRGNITAQARQPHLRGQKICLGEMNEKGDIVTHWNKIYKDV